MTIHFSSQSENNNPSLADQALTAYAENRAGSLWNILQAFLAGKFAGEEQKMLPIIEYEAENGDFAAQSVLGEILLSGSHGKTKDIEKSVYWLEKAAEQRDGKAQYLLATILEGKQDDGDNLLKALHLYVKAFQAGIPKSEYALGRFCENGICVLRDPYLAAFWYRRAYRQGIEEGKQAYERLMAELGEENWKSRIKKLFSRGAFPDTIMLAQVGDPTNQYDLGKTYMDGIFTPKNPRLGLEWLEKAAQQEFFKAPYQIGMAHYLGEGVEKNFQKAVYWFRVGAKLGHNMAQYALGCLYEEGEGVEKDIDLARYWYQMAIDAKFPPNEFDDLGGCKARDALEKLDGKKEV